MGTVNLPTTRAPGDTVLSQDYNDLRNVAIGDFVGRDNPSGVVTPCQRLGTFTVPWGEVHSKSYYENGRLLDFSSVIGANNLINSGRVRTTSELPDFIRADGSSPSFTLLATATPLVVTINGVTTSFIADQVEAGLITAPNVDNTALVNDPTLVGDAESLTRGENNTTIFLDNIGANIVAKAGEFVVFKHGLEYMMGLFGGDKIIRAYRGFFFDSAGSPIQRAPLLDNDVLELMSGAWIFVENDASTVDVTYNSPIFAGATPTSPVVGDYWLDLNTQEWKRYDGASFVVINRTLVGLAVIDGTNCIASRSFNFSKNYDSFQDTPLLQVTTNTLFPGSQNLDIDVYGFGVRIDTTDTAWNMTESLEPPQIEKANQEYYAYLTEVGGTILSDIAPFDMRSEIGQFLHPYNSWRFFARVTNNAAFDFEPDSLQQDNMRTQLEVVRTNIDNKLPSIDGQQVINQGRANVVVFNTAGAHVYNPLNKNIKKIVVELWGAGGGSHGAGIALPEDGTATIFGAFFSASPGLGASSGSLGGVGIGGNIDNLEGQIGSKFSGGGFDWGLAGQAPRSGAGPFFAAPAISYGGGGANNSNGTDNGGGGGYASSLLLSPPASVAVTVGTGGFNGAAGLPLAGQDGLVKIWEFY